MDIMYLSSSQTHLKLSNKGTVASKNTLLDTTVLLKFPIFLYSFILLVVQSFFNQIL